MIGTLKEIWEYRTMIRSLVHKDLRGRYQASVLPSEKPPVNSTLGSRSGSINATAGMSPVSPQQTNTSAVEPLAIWTPAQQNTAMANAQLRHHCDHIPAIRLEFTH